MGKYMVSAKVRQGSRRMLVTDAEVGGDYSSVLRDGASRVVVVGNLAKVEIGEDDIVGLYVKGVPAVVFTEHFMFSMPGSNLCVHVQNVHRTSGDGSMVSDTSFDVSVHHDEMINFHVRVVRYRGDQYDVHVNVLEGESAQRL